MFGCVRGLGSAVVVGWLVISVSAEVGQSGAAGRLYLVDDSLGLGREFDGIGAISGGGVYLALY